MKLVRLIKMCVTESCSIDRVAKYLFYIFPVTNGLQQDTLSPLYFNFALEYAIRMVSGNPGCLEIKWYTSAFGL